MGEKDEKRAETIAEPSQEGGVTSARSLVEDVRATWDAMDKVTLLAQCLVCLLPIVAGVLTYGRLPDMMAIHWGLGNEPNGWAPREFVVFGVPVMMALMQLVLVVSAEGAMLNARPAEGDMPSGEGDVDGQDGGKGAEWARPSRRWVKTFAVVYWLIPVITVVLYSMTIASALGAPVPVGKVVLGVLALILIVSGSYAQKVPYSIARKTTHPVPKSERAYRRYARACSYGMMALGFACLVGMLLV